MDTIKVLLVDDEIDFVEAMAERIKMRDIDAGAVFNGDKALELVVNQVPDVMVLDLQMPGLHGMEVLKQVKKTNPEVQVIILTGFGSETEKIQAICMGAYEYLRKPVEIERLVGIIRKAYRDRPRAKKKRNQIEISNQLKN